MIRGQCMWGTRQRTDNRVLVGDAEDWNVEPRSAVFHTVWGSHWGDYLRWLAVKIQLSDGWQLNFSDDGYREKILFTNWTWMFTVVSVSLMNMQVQFWIHEECIYLFKGQIYVAIDSKISWIVACWSRQRLVLIEDTYSSIRVRISSWISSQDFASQDFKLGFLFTISSEDFESGSRVRILSWRPITFHSYRLACD